MYFKCQADQSSYRHMYTTFAAEGVHMTSLCTGAPRSQGARILKTVDGTLFFSRTFSKNGRWHVRKDKNLHEKRSVLKCALLNVKKRGTNAPDHHSTNARSDLLLIKNSGT